jgi:diguanylate cyclase (GGDEF)-like protein
VPASARPELTTQLERLGLRLVVLGMAVVAARERELRRRQADLEALAGMAAALEGGRGEAEVLAVLLQTLIERFSFRRGAIWWTLATGPEGLVLAGAHQRVRPAPVEVGRQPDRVAAAAWSAGQALLVRRLDPDGDPVAVGLLPGARDVVVLPLPIDDQDPGIVLLEHHRHPLTDRLPRPTAMILGQFAAQAARTLRNVRLLAERERQAALDGLTGLANRGEFDRVLAREVNRAERSREPLSLVVFDVDHFKDINDSRGHQSGDEVLRAVGLALAGAVRDMDLVARYGGEEFALVLPRCDQNDAVRVVKRITQAIRQGRGLDGVTVSSGVATLPANAGTGVALVAAADEALYESKRAGRARYTVSDRDGPAERAGRGGPF